MADGAAELERNPPDRTVTDGLPRSLAAEIDLLAGRTEPWTDTDAAGLRARALVIAGRGAEARDALAGVDPAGLPLADVVAAGWAVSRVGPADLAPALAARVGDAGDVLIDDGLPLGPRDTLLGLLAVATGDVDRAVVHLRSGVRQGDARAPVWGALARLELGRVLLDLTLDRPDGSPADDERTEVGAAFASARIFFASGGYQALGTRLEALVSPSTIALDGYIARPGAGVLAPAGDTTWRVGFGVQPPVEVTSAKGLAALAHLIDQRGRNVPAVALDARLDGRPVAGPHGRDDADAEATLAELRDALVDDRARTRVSKLLHRTVDRLAAAHPRLGTHLRASITTGHACRYDAHPDVRWVR